MNHQTEVSLSVLLKTLIEVILENKDCQTAAHGILLLPIWLLLNGKMEHTQKQADDFSHKYLTDTWWGLNDQWVKKITEKFQKVFQKDQRCNVLKFLIWPMKICY